MSEAGFWQIWILGAHWAFTRRMTGIIVWKFWFRQVMLTVVPGKRSLYYLGSAPGVYLGMPLLHTVHVLFTCRYVLHIIDTDPMSLSANGWLEDTSKVQKYEMSDEAYAERENTYRKFKEQRLKACYFLSIAACDVRMQACARCSCRALHTHQRRK
jgi:hypothetical protein